jgi:hypothetical protein
MTERDREHPGAGGPGVEWLAESPFLHELGLRLARDLRVTRVLAGAAGVALVLLMAGLFLVARWGVELARRNEVMERRHEIPEGAAARVPVPPSLLLSGAPMPKEPRTDQMRAPCIGVRGVELRGACWEAYANPDPTKPCPSRFYDPPPEADGLDKKMCFVPIGKPDVPRTLEK